MEEAQSVLLALVNNSGRQAIASYRMLPAAGKLHWAELAVYAPQAANYRAAPLCNGDPDD
ncbi:hypothetical protein ACLBOM_14055 [Escherichia coli]